MEIIMSLVVIACGLLPAGIGGFLFYQELHTFFKGTRVEATLVDWKLESNKTIDKRGTYHKTYKQTVSHYPVFEFEARRTVSPFHSNSNTG